MLFITAVLIENAEQLEQIIRGLHFPRCVEKGPSARTTRKLICRAMCFPLERTFLSAFYFNEGSKKAAGELI